MQLIFEHGGRSIPFQSGHDLMKSLGYIQGRPMIMTDETGQVVGIGGDAPQLIKSQAVLAKGREILAKSQSGAAPLRSESNFSRRAKHDFSSVLEKLESLHRSRFA